MMIRILIISLFFLSFMASAQKGSERKLENKVSLAEYAFEKGNLEEASSLAATEIKRHVGQDGKPFAYFELWRIKALSDFYNARFEGFEEAEKQLKQESVKGGEASMRARLTLMAIYLETGQALKAVELAETKGETVNQPRFIEDQNLLLAEAYFQQGFYTQSLDLLSEQARYRERSLLQPDSTQSYYFQTRLNRREREMNYAKVKSLQARNLLAQGYVGPAKDSLNAYIDWVKSNLSDSRLLLCHAYLIQASLYEREDNQGEASRAYARAIQSAGNSDKAPLKAFALYKLASSQLFAGNRIAADAKIRELQIGAFQIAGTNEPVQPYYELISITRVYLEGSPRRAMAALERLRVQSRSIPEFHPFWKEYYSLMARLAYGSSEIAVYLEATGHLTRLQAAGTGRESVVSTMATLDELIKTNHFRGFVQASHMDIASSLKKINNEMNPDGVLIAGYYDLATDYYYARGLIDSALYFSEASLRLKPGRNKTDQLAALHYRLKNALLKGLKGDVQEANKLLGLYEKEALREGKTYSGQSFRNLLLLNQLYRLTEQKQKSIQLAGTLRNIRKPVRGFLNIPETIEADYALASVYAEAGNYYRAEKIIAERRGLIGKELLSGPFIYPLILLEAELRLINGDFDEAEKGIVQAIHLGERYFGSQSLQLAQARYLYASYFDAIADYTNARAELGRASELFTGALGAANSFSPNLYLLQAELSIRSGHNSEETGKLYTKALEIARDSYLESGERYNKILISYADYLIRLQKYDEASKLLDKAYAYFQNSGDNKSLLFANVLRTRGKLYYARREYVAAEKEFLSAETIIKDRLSKEHPVYNACMGELARSYFMRKQTEKAIQVMEETIPRYLKYIETLFPGMSFRQKSGYWSAFKDEFEFYNYLLLSNYANNRPAELGKVYNNIIATKAILLSSDRQTRQNIEASGDSSLISMFERWAAQKEFLSSVYGLNKTELAELGVSIEELEKEIEHEEKNISLRSSYFADNSIRRKADWKSIRGRLSANESVIEMSRIRYFNHTFTDSAFYAALALNGNREFPVYVEIPKAEELEGRYYKYHRNTLVLNIEDEYSYNKFWAPIASVVGDSRSVYFSPDGIYYQLNPETFRTPENHFLIDKQSITFLSNSKDLLHAKLSAKNKRNQPGAPSVFVLGGNPSYYSDGKYGNVAQLPGAEKEVVRIGELLSKHGIQTRILTGSALTEDTVKALRNHQVLHFATHGYFQESSFKDDNSRLSNPLLNSGLLFYGGGELLEKGENINSRGGILTAYEAASLNLSNTDLVVLSACETGRGEILNGEGVFGLQRSLLLAGADAIIMTLFKVRDEVAQTFMYHFYEEYIRTGDKRKAFALAKRKIKENDPSPLSWGAFLMIESSPGKEMLTLPSIH